MDSEEESELTLFGSIGVVGTRVEVEVAVAVAIRVVIMVDAVVATGAVLSHGKLRRTASSQTHTPHMA